MPVKFEEVMKELFAPNERTAIRRTATMIAKRLKSSEQEPLVLRGVGRATTKAKKKAA